MPCQPKILIFLALCVVGLLVPAMTAKLVPQKYTITKTWNNQTEPDEPRIDLTFSTSPNNSGLLISVNAPFYNNIMPDEEPGFVDGLWDYEVVEVFFLGPNEKYLEIELGPGGHYLTYFLEGVRNVTNTTLPIEYFDVVINETEQRWSGSAVIPLEYLPPGVNQFNAYAIHNLTDPNGGEDVRRYMALFPVPTGEFPGPDFHRLEYFQKIDLSEIIDSVNVTKP